MILKSSYIVTENNALLRCGPVLGRRQIVALGLAAIASVAAGLVAFSVLSAGLPGQSRVAWSLQPSHVVRTATVKPLIIMTSARVVPSVTQTAEQGKGQPGS